MATDLKTLATNETATLEAAAKEISDLRRSWQNEIDARTADAAIIADPNAWASPTVGATQHETLANDALALNRSEETTTRAALAGVTSPADAATHEAALRALLIEAADLRVHVRTAKERRTAAYAALDQLSKLEDQAARELVDAGEFAEWAEKRTEQATKLRAAFAAPEVAAVRGQAAALSDAAARARLTALLPDKLRSRAIARGGEATDLLQDAENHAAVADDAVDGQQTASQPLDAAVASARRDLEIAEAGLQDYVARAVPRLAQAADRFSLVALHPDLTAAQNTALTATAARDDAVDKEQALADAITASSGAARTRDDAILNALATNVDADLTADAVVPGAITAAATAEAAVATARGDYDSVAAELAAWEAEVPVSLWQAVSDYSNALAVKQELSDQPSRDALHAAVGDAEDAVETAVQARNKAVRARWVVERSALERRARSIALAETTAARFTHFVQGDGSAGRSLT